MMNVSLRMASSSASMISNSVTSACFWAKAKTTSTASAGFTANIPLYIFTPDGTPSTGVESRPCMASKMSLAVPSPPTNTIKSTCEEIKRLIAFFVSSAVVLSEIFIGKSSVGRVVACASLFPIIPGQVKTSILVSALFCFSFWRNSVALFGAIGSAPLAIASLRTLSVPFRPTLPPIPAIGLTMKPSRMIYHGQDWTRGV